MPLSGGAPRELLEDVTFADWSPNGAELAVIRVARSQRMQWLEYPRGKIIYRGSRRYLHDARVSRRGDLVAFFEGPDSDADYARVVVTDRVGDVRVQSSAYSNSTGLAWSADGQEVWFTRMGSGGSRALHALDLSGRERTVLRVPAWLTLKDISPDGRVLLCKETENWGVMAFAPGQSGERDLSWYNWSLLDDISADGTRIVFSEGGEAGEDRWGIYIRGTDGGAAARLGDGVFGSLSPDGRWVVASRQYREDGPSELVLLPTGAGEARMIRHGPMDIRARSSGWLPDSTGFLYAAETEGGRPRTYLVSLSGGEPRPITSEGTVGTLVSPDGSRLVARRSQEWVLCPLAGGPEEPVLGIDHNWTVLGWDPDGTRLRIAETASEPLNLMLLDPYTGDRQPWKRLVRTASLDRAGLMSLSLPRFSRDGRAYAYTYHRQLSDLYVVHGLR
jgi:Tol biopolymer transport system component